MIGFGQSSPRRDFERQILPHLDAAYSLARFLMRNEQDAEDAVQEACLRAFRFYEGFRGENSRAWFLSIVDRDLDWQVVRVAIEQLPTEFREVITLRELEGCSYKEIAENCLRGVPPAGAVHPRPPACAHPKRAGLSRTSQVTQECALRSPPRGGAG